MNRRIKKKKLKQREQRMFVEFKVVDTRRKGKRGFRKIKVNMFVATPDKPNKNGRVYSPKTLKIFNTYKEHHIQDLTTQIISSF